MSNIKLKDYLGQEQTHNNVESLTVEDENGNDITFQKENWVSRTTIQTTKDTSVIDIIAQVKFRFHKSYCHIVAYGNTVQNTSQYTRNGIVGLFHEGTMWLNNAMTSITWVNGKYCPNDFTDGTITAYNLGTSDGRGYSAINQDGTIDKSQYGVSNDIIGTADGYVEIIEIALEHRLWGEN